MNISTIKTFINLRIKISTGSTGYSSNNLYFKFKTNLPIILNKIEPFLMRFL